MTTNDDRAIEAKDRDETRRLLYMALLASRTEHYELAATLSST